LKVYYYRKSSGKIPVLEFIKSLPDHDKQRIFFDLSLINQKGLKNCGLSLRHLDGKLWEIRFKLSAGYRIFYCLITEDIFLLHAYKKQSQKAPEKEIAIAINRMKELLK
jgi:Phage-related protein